MERSDITSAGRELVARGRRIAAIVIAFLRSLFEGVKKIELTRARDVAARARAGVVAFWLRLRPALAVVRARTLWLVARARAGARTGWARVALQAGRARTGIAALWVRTRPVRALVRARTLWLVARARAGARTGWATVIPVATRLRSAAAARVRAPSPTVMRRSLTTLAALLALGGIGLMAYPFATDLWAARIQSGLAREFAAASPTFSVRTIKTGDPLTKLEIPRLGVDVMVVEGATQEALRAGAGHYPDTPLPGEKGNVAIAGHRTTYGRPFNDMDKLVPGDRVILTTPAGRHVYRITTKPWVVEPTDWSPIRDYPKGASLLTLTSCHPEGSADYRIVVRAELVHSSDVVAEATG